MENTKDRFTSFQESANSPGDAAIDGLVRGILAGVVMAAFLALVIVAVSSRALFVSGSEILVDLVMHTAVSGIYGALFGLIVFLARPRITSIGSLNGIPAGLIYGFLLWVVGTLLIFPGSDLVFADLSAGLLAAAHLLYGGILGYVSLCRR
jgi:hypothetical protein